MIKTSIIKSKFKLNFKNCRNWKDIISNINYPYDKLQYTTHDCHYLSIILDDYSYLLEYYDIIKENFLYYDNINNITNIIYIEHINKWLFFKYYKCYICTYK